MSQKIKAEIILEIPNDKVIISKAEFDEYQSLKDEGRWWTSKDVEKHYNHKMDWFKGRIFYIPKYKKILSTENGGCVHYADLENGRY